MIQPTINILYHHHSHHMINVSIVEKKIDAITISEYTI